MKRLILLLALLAASGAHAATATLTWTTPTQNCDGTPLTGLTGFKVYWGSVGRVAAFLPATSSGECDDPSQVPHDHPMVENAYPNRFAVAAITTSTTIVLPDDGKTYYFSVTTLADGGESNLANEVSKVAPLPSTPQVPLNLQVH